MSELLVSRRRLLGAGALGAGALALPAWARGADLHGNESIRPGFDEVSGRDIALTIGEGPRVVQGRRDDPREEGLAARPAQRDVSPPQLARDHRVDPRLISPAPGSSAT